jgi:hypothetical protein
MSTTGEHEQKRPIKWKQKPVYVVIPLGFGVFGLLDVYTHKVYQTAYPSQVEAREAARRLSDPGVVVTETWKE